MHRLMILLGLSALLFSGCQSLPFFRPAGPVIEGEEIAFEIVATSDDGWKEVDETSQLLVVTSPADLPQLQSLIWPESVQAVQQVDLDLYSMIAVFRHIRICARSGVRIENVAIQDNTLTVYAQFQVPDGACGEDSNAPYQVIKVSRQDADLDRLDVVLHGREVLQR